MAIALVAPPRHQSGVVENTDAPVLSAVILRLPCTLSEIEGHVLSPVAVHCWTHDGAIPYIPPNRYQALVARRLAVRDVRLLLAFSIRRGGHSAYCLSRLGEHVAHRVLDVVFASYDGEQECEFDRMRSLMRNEWEVSE